jgi:ABC-type branched-subunit amino acid transport system substrate-binding protein
VGLLVALDSQVGLVGRDDTAALIELLMKWRPRRQLPVLVAFGPGGSGKTALLDHVQRRYRDMPIARVNLDEAGSLGCEDILAAVFDDLRSFTHPEFGRIELPRYALARLAMMCESPAAEDGDPYASTRQLLARRPDGLPQAARAFAEVAGLFPAHRWFTRLFRPLLAWLARVAVLAPGWSRRWLVGSTMAHALNWFERTAAKPHLLDLARGSRVDAVFVRLRRLVHGSDVTDRTGADRERLDRLLVAAFVADIAEAFRGRRRRRANCLLLLDGADLLEPFEYSMFESSRGVFPSPQTDFLQLLAEARLAQPGAPLLVIATKQSSSDLAEIEPQERVVPANGFEPTAAEIAAARYEGWVRRFGAARTVTNSFFPVRLRPFTLAQTEQFVVEWNRRQGSTGASQVLLAELHEVTKGHPLAVRLAIEAINLDYQSTMVQPSVRSVFAQRLQGEARQRIGEYLLARFLQRFRVGADVEERAKTRAVLARLAAPLLIDEQTIALLTPELDPRDTFLRLRHYSFAELFERDSVVTDPLAGAHPHRDRYLTLHPLLRDLLAETLLHEPAPGLLTYAEVHELLKQRFHDDHNRTAELYHTLALGEVASVAAQLKQDVQTSRAGWPAMLEQIAEAPTRDRVRRPLRGERLDRWRHRLGVTVRRDANTVRDLVEDMWRLRSATSTAQYSAEAFERIAKDYIELAELAAPDGDTTALDERDNYQRLAETAVDRALPRNAEPLPGYVLAEEKFPYPSVLFKPRTVHRVALAAVVLLLAGYFTVFGVQLNNDCISGNPFDAISLGSSVLNPDTTLNKTPTGECVGVTGSVSTFAYATADPTDPTEVAEAAEINTLSSLIYTQNQRVIDQTDSVQPLPYVTVVVSTMFSSANQQPFLDLSVGVNELRGAYLAQEMWNQLDTGQRKPPFLLRLLLANFGGDSVYAAQAATQIQQLAEHDSSVLAVTGMGQTREQTISAASTLGTAAGGWSGIPVVTSAPSGEAFAGKDYVFMTAATNPRQADVGTAFVQSHFPNRKLYVIYDPNDLYSNDLYNDYGRSLANADLPPAIPEIYDADSNDTRQSLTGIVGDICSHSGPNTQAPMILYAGRANELPTFMDLLQGNTCDQRAVVLGDDDLTQEETNGYADLTGISNFVNTRLYFTSFGPTRDGWQRILADGDLPAQQRAVEQSAETSFFNAYNQLARQEHGTAYQTPANGHIMLAYDAVNLAVSAIQSGISGGQLPDRTEVYDQLRDTTGVRAYPGASGPIDFQTTDPAPLNKGGFDANKLVVVQEVRKDPASGKLGSAYVYSQP